ncbi:MAG: hypothetical protein WCL20_03995 [Actinomycetes bacterium]
MDRSAPFGIRSLTKRQGQSLRAVEAQAEPTGVIAASSRDRDHDSPGDLEYHQCCCGYGFTAEVSAGAKCPACSGDQPW